MNHLSTLLAYEEPDIFNVSITPGIVDTGIQKLVREQRKFSQPAICSILCITYIKQSFTVADKDTLDPETYDFLTNLHEQGKMLLPDQPAASFVKLATDGIPQEIMGQTISWDDLRIKTT